MWLHIFCARMKMQMRNKDTLLWSLVFSLALGTLFYVAFSSIYDSGKSTTIPIACVEPEQLFSIPEEGVDKNIFKEYNELFELKNKNGVLSFAEILKQFTYEDGTKMFQVKKAELNEAKKWLQKEKIDGILYVKENMELTLFVKKSGIHESILTSVVGMLRRYIVLIRETIVHSPEKFTDVLSGLKTEVSLLEQKSLSGKNKDPYVAYFYNLIAMICMMASMGGASVPITSQANLSAVGARGNLAPVQKHVYELAGFLAVFFIQTAITAIGLSYLVFVLHIHFGGNIGIIYLTAILGTLLSVSLGFFIGHIGSSSEKKYAILTAVTVGGGFLSGLMYGGMKVLIEKHMPILNWLNPSAVMTDAFYSLNMFGVSGRYYRSMVFMGILTCVCIAGGMILARRKQFSAL